MPAPDDFSSLPQGIDGPASKATPITPNDGADIAVATRGIYVGGGGDLRVDMQGGGPPVTFFNVAPSTVQPIRVSRVYATGTTATNLVGLR